MVAKSSTLLLFGATGDLARRMLLPSLYGLDSDGLLPDELRIIGTARTELDDAAFRERADAALQRAFARRLLPGRRRRALPRAAPLRPARHQRPGGVRAACRDDRRSVPRRRDLPVDRAVPVQADDRRAGGGRPGLPDGAHGARKAARHRPRIEPRDQRRGRRRLPRGADLPDRPLSRQGNRPEPARAALRQSRCSSRCGTARISTMSRSRSPRRSGSKGAAIITTVRARFATWSRTTCSSCLRWWRWSRRPISTRPRCATRR